jgi:hypothetical protein
VDRFVRALAANRKPTYGISREVWEPGIIGALGECVIARASNNYWQGDLGHPDWGAPDVGPFHVRTSTKANGDLVLHPRDADDEPFVLVVPIALPVFRIAGWIAGRDGKRPEFWQTFTGRPCYFVPQNVLHPWKEIS